MDQASSEKSDYYAKRPAESPDTVHQLEVRIEEKEQELQSLRTTSAQIVVLQNQNRDLEEQKSRFENINDQPVCVAYVPPTHMYWASGRFGRLMAYDPRYAHSSSPHHTGA